jgi:S1-C subfamily serine protease
MARRLPFFALLVCILTVSLRAETPESINLRKTIVVDVVKRTKAAVVNISTTKLISQRVSPFGNDPFWQQFDVGQVVKVPENFLGSGFIIDPEGYVVTNNHVIDRARQITVELDDGRKLPAVLISADPDADLALLRITDRNPFPSLSLGDSSDLMMGEPAIAIGNPFGYSQSVSTGIVSALHRDLNDSDGHATMHDLIQTDAAINPGNSGGPLLNAYGQVIGINTAIRSNAQNIGFAIPVDSLRDLIPELMSPTQVEKLDVPLKLTEQREVSPPARITCHILTGQNPPRVVRAIDGVQVTNIVQACDLLLRAKAGVPMNIEFADGTAGKIVPRATPLPDAIVQARRRLGMVIEPLTPMLAEQLHLSQEDGLFIDGVTDNGPAAKAGLQRGDILFALGRFRVTNLESLSALFSRMPTSGHIRILVIRNGEVASTALELGGN